MSNRCRANESAAGLLPQKSMAKASKSMNHGPWEGHGNEQRFFDALTNFMNESWSVVCQVRERSGLSSEYQMSSTEIAKRIEDISKKLENKYKEVQALEEQKSLLLSKAPRQQPPVQSVGSRQMGYGTNPSMSYTGGGSGYYPSTTLSSGASSAPSPRRRMQYTGGACGPSCESTCPNYSGG